MRPSLALDLHRDAIRKAAESYGLSNPRVVGSTARGEDREGSDLDLLVDVNERTSLFDLGGLLEELKALLGVPVDVLTPEELPLSIRARVLRDAQPL